MIWERVLKYARDMQKLIHSYKKYTVVNLHVLIEITFKGAQIHSSTLHETYLIILNFFKKPLKTFTNMK